MADIVARDPLTPGAAARPQNSGRSSAERGEPANQPPRSDVGTILLHWTTAVAFVVSLVTGIRIATFAFNFPRLSQWLSPITPQGEIWTWHFLAGLALFFCSTAYLLYILRSGLSPRNALKKIRLLLMPVGPKMRWQAVNVGLHWFVYVLITVMTVTGVILYLGYGGWWAWIHSISALIGFGYVFLHVLTHYMFGGWWQLFRLFRPAELVATPAMKSYPLLIASLVGVATIAIAAGVDWSTRDTLTITHVTPAEAPKIDGLLDDAVWAKARPVFVHTQQGVNLGGTGESLVEVRAVHDGQKVYFAFRWEDPTRSLRRVPVIKREDGWHLLGTRVDFSDVQDFYEDKLAVGFSRSPAFGAGESTYMGSDPLPGKPKPLHGMGYHYVEPGNLMDIWQWKATRAGHVGRMDDQFFDAPLQPTPNEAAGKARYQAGYGNDPGKTSYSYTFVGEPPNLGSGPLQLKRLPKDWQATVKALGKYDLDPNSSDEDGARWYMMTDTETVPYSAEVDATIPVGTVIPGVLIQGDFDGDRADLHAAPKWKDGHWHLEVVRALRTGSKYDHDFVPGQNLYMWVNVFDHTQVRHTRHVRGIRIVTQE
jgi:cytochrome b subunit of formate dehydrogenase